MYLRNYWTARITSTSFLIFLHSRVIFKLSVDFQGINLSYARRCVRFSNIANAVLVWFSKSQLGICTRLFYFILFYFIVFYFIYFVLFYFILFYFILFYFILFYFILFYFILFYFILFYFILFYFILFYSLYYMVILTAETYITVLK